MEFEEFLEKKYQYKIYLLLFQVYWTFLNLKTLKATGYSFQESQRNRRGCNSPGLTFFKLHISKLSVHNYSCCTFRSLYVWIFQRPLGYGISLFFDLSLFFMYPVYKNNSVTDAELSSILTKLKLQSHIKCENYFTITYLHILLLNVQI